MSASTAALPPNAVPTSSCIGVGQTFTVEEFYPVYFSAWERETGQCSICCNQVEGPCVVCQSNAEATSVECSITWGECGHAFHTHCIEKWLKTRAVCPLDNKEWKDRADWNTSATV
ncbi:ring-box protein [Novymonas esmeraldas]|uniref:Ring-box protein n=1 Tax=Novymonas esmeraldas TaxID=1808958 RepID=A0AAW0ENI1_9TRYP